LGGGEEKAEFKIDLTPRAYRNLTRLLKTNESLARRVSEKVDSLSQQPMLGKPLVGVLKGSRSLRIGSYRVIYKVDTAKREVLVTNVGHRRGIYDR
jgi:mRNA interferase RelE/StbE